MNHEDLIYISPKQLNKEESDFIKNLIETQHRHEVSTMNKYRIIQNGQEKESSRFPEKIKNYLVTNGLGKENNGVF